MGLVSGRGRRRSAQSSKKRRALGDSSSRVLGVARVGIAHALSKPNSNKRDVQVSKRNTQVLALAGAVALAGFGYTLARRSSSRSASARPPRASTNTARRAETRPTPEAVGAAEPASWQDSQRISSAPDALDVALNLDGVFDGKSASGVEVTARPDQHLPALLTGDDEDACAPEDLGAAWLRQATESERSLGFADTIPNFEDLDLPKASIDANSDNAEEADETTAEYIRLHRISSVG